MAWGNKLSLLEVFNIVFHCICRRSENHQKWRSVLDQAKLYLMRTLDQTHEGYTAALMAYALSDTNVSSQAMTNLRNHLILNQEINTFSIATNDNAPSTIEGN